MRGLSRSTALKVAAGLSFLMGAISIVSTLPMVAQGANAVDQGNAGPPYMVVILSFVMGIVAFVGAYGAWRGQRWGIILTILANLINGLSAAPGVLFAPVPMLQIMSILTVVVSIVVIVLCLWRDRQPIAA